MPLVWRWSHILAWGTLNAGAGQASCSYGSLPRGVPLEQDPSHGLIWGVLCSHQRCLVGAGWLPGDTRERRSVSVVGVGCNLLRVPTEERVKGVWCDVPLLEHLVVSGVWPETWPRLWWSCWDWREQGYAVGIPNRSHPEEVSFDQRKVKHSTSCGSRSDRHKVKRMKQPWSGGICKGAVPAISFNATTMSTTGQHLSGASRAVLCWL